MAISYFYDIKVNVKMVNSVGGESIENGGGDSQMYIHEHLAKNQHI